MAFSGIFELMALVWFFSFRQVFMTLSKAVSLPFVGRLFMQGVHKERVPVYDSYWPCSVQLPVAFHHYRSTIIHSADAHNFQTRNLWAHRTPLSLISSCPAATYYTDTDGVIGT